MSSRSSEEADAFASDANVLRRQATRHRAEKRFRAYGFAAILLALSTLLVLFVSIARQGAGAFVQSVVELEFRLDPAKIDPSGGGDLAVIGAADYSGIVKARLREMFPEVSGRNSKRNLYALMSNGAAYALREAVLEDPTRVGQTLKFVVPLSDDADLYVKGHVSRDVPESERRLRDEQLDWLDALRTQGVLTTRLNWGFLTSGDSREPELAGIGGALVGTLLTLFVTLALSFPLGVATAIYLEEFAPRGRLTDLIEVNINNLAAVPSVIFGLLGLAIFLSLMGMTRSAPVVGGLVLALRTLPIIIIASRAALAAVPPSIREAAMGIGASPVQVVGHHVLPSAMPGILTGTIIGMAQALGETAPLLMIGMVAFIVDVPSGFESPATVLPVQIFLWADAPERAFVEKTSGAILVLLAFLVSMNATAVWLRSRFEKRL
jgi:phosphate transport system permease protein